MTSPPQSSGPSQEPSAAVSTPPAEKPAESLPSTEEPAEPTAPAVGQVAMVYIGTKAGGFTDSPMIYDGELTAEKLVQGIADLTGWDLTLAGPVISGKGGMSVCLSAKSPLFTGEGGDPDTLDIWYCMEGARPLELPALGLSWPIDQPYQWAGAESE